MTVKGDRDRGVRMCGLAGVLDTSLRSTREGLLEAADRMAAAVAHRGPDAAGHWCDPRHGIALAHRRLAILDLTEAADQPMLSPEGRFALVFNGEIYNFHELRALLEKQRVAFRGSGDTEVLLAAISAWGLPRALDRLNGMFALAVWDAHERRLTLARDRL